LTDERLQKTLGKEMGMGIQDFQLSKRRVLLHPRPLILCLSGGAELLTPSAWVQPLPQGLGRLRRNSCTNAGQAVSSDFQVWSLWKISGLAEFRNSACAILRRRSFAVGMAGSHLSRS
jgi:hypothetical protein